ncbi:IS1380 family transposase [Marinobacter gelidimuriae]|uniref:IS1380 family transposase n=1 Tax=Marinobacter gelidimuriae TaxID=2739064 RepID=UPI00037D60F5|nr:IS1380 family transposase [Marinobacter gelidimuriae]
MILPYKLDTTNDLLTSRAGLLATGQLMDTLSLAERIDKHFPQPKSNRGYKPSEFIKTLILMQHEGSFHLDEVRHIQDDEALRTVLDLKKLPQATTIGDWLRRMGSQPQIQEAWVKVNKAVLQSALHRCKKVTLDIDATEIVAHKADAQWTYNKNKGFMPMVGHIAETGQVVAVDFRQGNVPPAKDNLAFIKQCQQALPEGCALNALRIDAAGYQIKIIEYCDEQGIEYAIRAKTSPAMRAQIDAAGDADWQPLIDKKGKEISGQDTYRTSFCIGKYEKAFTLIIQRTAIKGQANLDLDSQEDSNAISRGGYVYRAIATNRDKLSDSQIVHWYNQRAEDSENRIKELKLDFGGDTLPCSDFNANALYFLISSLSYNLFALMRQLLPEELAHHRAMTLRWRLYAMAAKVVKTGRQLFVKLKENNRTLLEQVLLALKEFEPPPI